MGLPLMTSETLVSTKCSPETPVWYQYVTLALYQFVPGQHKVLYIIFKILHSLMNGISSYSPLYLLCLLDSILRMVFCVKIVSQVPAVPDWEKKGVWSRGSLHLVSSTTKEGGKVSQPLISHSSARSRCNHLLLVPCSPGLEPSPDVMTLVSVPGHVGNEIHARDSNHIHPLCPGISSH